MEDTPQLNDYQYELPEDFIAKFPLEKRDASNLLHFEDGRIGHHRFSDLPTLLPKNSHLVFNDTRVIPARLHFKKITGGVIELFLLNPVAPSTLIQESMQSQGPVVWKCMIGNLKRWKSEEAIKNEIRINQQNYELKARLVARDSMEVEFSWTPSDVSFAALVEAAGEIPLPPYLNRKAEETDKLRYQTVYSKIDGAVAAPTAGLHFTEQTLKEIRDKNIPLHYLTLHVGAGTFLPIKHDNITEHPMHREQMVFTKETVTQLYQASGNIVAVGTTSMRSLESLYWYGVNLISDPSAEFFIEKLAPYDPAAKAVSRQESFEAVLRKMEQNKSDHLIGATEIFIFPGYRFRVCNGLITNFHQPGSTLILLIAAFTNQQWRKIYTEALAKRYRFLSYGDSSLLWNKKISH